jgi:hypothetical protein
MTRWCAIARRPNGTGYDFLGDLVQGVVLPDIVYVIDDNTLLLRPCSQPARPLIQQVRRCCKARHLKFGSRPDRLSMRVDSFVGITLPAFVLTKVRRYRRISRIHETYEPIPVFRLVRMAAARRESYR